MQRRNIILTLIILPILAAAGADRTMNEPIVGLPCEGCEAVFVGTPKVLSSRSRIAPADEPGEPMHLTGGVVDRKGAPKAGVIVYAYQTNAQGIYPMANPSLPGWAGRHGRLRAWARTDAQGRYSFDTVRPGSYPEGGIPQHIHLHIIEPGRATYYIDDVMFTDDPLLTPRSKEALVTGRGGAGVVTPARRDGVWWVQRDIVLGHAIPGYPSDHVL